MHCVLIGHRNSPEHSLSVSRAVEICYCSILGKILRELGLQQVRTVHLRHDHLDAEVGTLESKQGGMPRISITSRLLSNHCCQAKPRGSWVTVFRLQVPVGKLLLTHNLNLPPRSLSAFIAPEHTTCPTRAHLPCPCLIGASEISAAEQ